MKRILLFALIAMISVGLKAQNTFPSNGNVGIGTTNPYAGFHLTKFRTDSRGDNISAILGNGYNHWTLFGGQTGGRIRGSVEGYLSIESNPNGTGDKRLYLNLNSPGIVTIANGGGNVGIGTISPYSRLHVQGASGNTKLARFFNSDYTTGIGSGLMINTGSPTGDTYVMLQAYTKGANDIGNLILNSIGGNVGIGTVNPKHKLEIVGNGAVVQVKNASQSMTEGSLTNIVRGADKDDNTLWYLGDGSSIKRILLTARGDGNYPLDFEVNSVTRMRIATNGNVGIGTGITNPTSMLTVAGKIESQEVEVKVDAGADFVFEKDYPIKDLEQVEAYIKANKHLEDIPSAKEMKENGLELGEMNIRLLQKVEELTLYAIEQNKKIKDKSKKIKELEEAKVKTEVKVEKLEEILKAQQKAIEELKKEMKEMKKSH